MAKKETKFIRLDPENRWVGVYNTLKEAENESYDSCEIFEVVRQYSSRDETKHTIVNIGNGLNT